MDQFDSMYDHCNFNEKYETDLEGFVKTYLTDNQPIHSRVLGYYGRNQQLCDSGLNVTQLTDLKAVKHKIKQIEKDFDLVMITEQFEESIVLMSDLLCWPLTEVISWKQRVRKNKTKISEHTRKVLKDWLWADEMLYNHFKKVLGTLHWKGGWALMLRTLFGIDCT